MEKGTILVTGATGTQGGATARALLRSGREVRALVRDPDAPKAIALREAGCDLHVGDFEQPDTLRAAVEGVSGVFSVQRPDLDGSNSERRHGFALINAAKAAGVPQLVHSSVCQVADHEDFPRWDEGYWSVSYWTDKWAVEEHARQAGFAYLTVLRPSFIMENFTHAKAQFLFPQLQDGTLLSPIAPDSRIQLIAGQDIGAFAAAAFQDPDRFAGQAIELVGDDLTLAGIAQVLSDVCGASVEPRSVSPDEALDAGLPPPWVRSQEWINDVGYAIDPSPLEQFPVALTDFHTWVRNNRHSMEIYQ